MQTQFQSSVQQFVQQRKKWRYLVILLTLGLLTLLQLTGFAMLPAAAAGTIYYVKPTAAANGDGSSWDNAYRTVQDALAAVKRGDQIWIAAGVYYPDEGGEQTDNKRNTSFTIPAGVSLYGGFAGGERSLTERDWQQNVTVLSGDIDQNDKTDANGVVASSSHISGSNSVHVLYLDGTTNAITGTTVIDGFVITAGQADGVQDLDKNGGGLFCNGFTTGECSPLLTNVTFSGNFANTNGGAVFNDGRNGGKSSPTLLNVIFSGNSAYSGGAIYNAAWDGGNGSPVLTNVIFSGNSARSWCGGALFNQGERNGNSSPVLTNVTLSGNSAAMQGGAICNYAGVSSATGSSNPTLTNVILWQNLAPVGPSIYNIYGKSTISHSIVENGASSITGTITNSLLYDASNTQSDPLFVQPIAPASAPTSTGDLRLQPGSPAIDSGDNSALPASITTDADGKQRSANGTVDIGAYEFAELRIARPDQLNGLIANLEARMQPVVDYTGYDELAFSLTEAPDNMTIDLSTGLIRWTPQVADEGKSYTVTVSVNDGSQFAETSFQVSVLAPEPVATTITGNVLTVVDPATTLNGMSITPLDGESLAAVRVSIGKLAGGVAPARPAWVSLLSDVLVVRGSFDHAVALRFPLPPLPENVALDDVDLYAFTQAWDVEGQLWTSVWMDIDYEGTPAAPIVVVKLSGLRGMVAWGYTVPQAESAASAPMIQKRPLFARYGLAAPVPQPDVVTCTAQMALNQKVADICTTAKITVTIRGWGEGATRWNGPTQQEAGVTKEKLVGWLLQAQSKSLTYGLGFSNTFNIEIGPLSGYDGLVVPTTFNTLQLNNDNTYSTARMQATAVHEYFHHVQMYTMMKLSSRKWTTAELMDNSQIAWIMEGTAVWFEDQLNDTTDEYANLLGKSGLRIAAAGINSVKGSDLSDPYQRFSFFKLLTRSCPNFESKFHLVLNVDRATDPSGIKNLVSLFGNDHFACNFGNHLEARSAASLGAALAYYNYATQFKGKISLLDANEADTGFRFAKPNFQFAPQPTNVAAWLALPNSTIALTLPSSIPAAGAYSFNIPALAGDLPADKVAELSVTGSGAITVSITSTNSQFISANTIGAGADLAFHTWFTTTQKTEHVYSANGKVPALFVTLVNPSPTEKVSNLKVAWRLRNASLPAVSIREPQDGAQVSNRVITVTGMISESARLATKHVLVTANGIAANAPIQPNGAFTAQVVVALGQNSIKVQGMDNQTPTTTEKVITVQGVATDSTEPNALIASRVVFVLRWDTAETDVDIYTTDKSGASIWYSHTVAGPGTLDFDHRDGFGPEVISYRAVITDDAIYVDGTFDVDLHYFAGSPSTNFTLDVILNETEAKNLLTRQYRSAQPLVTANSDQHAPDGVGDSRFNNILRIACSPQRVCNLAAVDDKYLIRSGNGANP